MKIKTLTAAVSAALVLAAAPVARAQQHTEYDRLVAAHAKANQVPEALVHRVILRESKYQPNLLGHGGTIGLMQIKLATARGLGYTGTAEGLRDPATNLTYGIKYLAGAYRAANGNHDRAVTYYASGYYYIAKRQRLEGLRLAAHAPPVVLTPVLEEEPAVADSEPSRHEAEGAVEARAARSAMVPKP